MDALNPIADLPIGLGTTLSQNSFAMENFASLSPDEQRRVIDQTHTFHSKREMQSLVQSLTGQRDL